MLLRTSACFLASPPMGISKKAATKPHALSFTRSALRSTAHREHFFGYAGLAAERGIEYLSTISVRCWCLFLALNFSSASFNWQSLSASHRWPTFWARATARISRLLAGNSYRGDGGGSLYCHSIESYVRFVRPFHQPSRWLVDGRQLCYRRLFISGGSSAGAVCNAVRDAPC